jgi:tetratricopeptide (TPR) repeat protein
MFATLSVLILTLVLLGGTFGSAKATQCTIQKGQQLIEAGQNKKAIHEFSCVIDAQPTEVEGYRGRIEAELLLGRYSDAVRDYARITVLVLPVHPDAENTMVDGYADRLAVSPQDIPALTGASFARWCLFDYNAAIQLLNQLLDVQPDSVYGNLFRGSSRLLQGVTKAKGVVDLERAITLAPQSADVRFIVADAYTYGLPDPQRAFSEASLALAWGLDTPRIHAILGASYNAFGDQTAAAEHIQTHIEQVTTELVMTSLLPVGTTFTLDLVPGRTYEIPVPVTAGQTISIDTSSPDFWDTILVLLAPNGTPVLGSDDTNAYFAAIEWTAEETGTYLLRVTSFESVSFGELVVERD